MWLVFPDYFSNYYDYDSNKSYKVCETSPFFFFFMFFSSYCSDSKLKYLDTNRKFIGKIL